jgi:uncharacterized protein (UPF0335 family)
MLAFWALLQLQPCPAPKPKSDDAANKVAMPYHSLTPPLDHTASLDDWFLSGSALLERQRVLMHPGIKERHGFMFGKQPLLTNNFEALVKFRVNGTQAPAKDAGFAVWLVQDNASALLPEKDFIKDWPAGMKNSGWNLVGMSQKFTGFGVVLTPFDAEEKLNPVVSLVRNDGSSVRALGTDVPISGASAPYDSTKGVKAIDWRNTLNPAQLKIRVTPHYIEAYIKQSPSLSWNECFKLEVASMVGTYLGISAWSGSEVEGAADQFAIMSLEVFNHDTTHAGEDLKAVSSDVSAAAKELISEEHSHFKDQAAQLEQLDKIILMLDKHINSTKPSDAALFVKLEDLQSRMNRLNENCGELTQEVKILLKEKHPRGHLEHMMGEIKGLRTIFTSGSAQHRERIERVQQKTAEIKESKSGASPKVLVDLADKTQDIEIRVAEQSSRSSWLLMIMLIAVVGIGLLMYNRMNYYEKKHFM